MSKHLVVGLAPAASMKPGAPAFIGTDSWKRFAVLAGVTTDYLESVFDTVNVCETYPGRKPGGGDNIPPAATMREGVVRIKRLLSQSDYQTVIGFGATVAYHFGFKESHWFSPHTLLLSDVADAKACTFFPVPHPGGTNRFWNDHHHRELLRVWFNKLYG